MKVEHSIHTTTDSSLSVREAVALMQDVERSLSEVGFLKSLKVTPCQGRQRVQAVIPLQVPLVGAYDLAFVSELEFTPSGAKLYPLPLKKTAWAEISGRAEVTARPGGSRLRYELELLVHIDLPEPERWGSRALLKMAGVTAQRVIADITAGFPQAIAAAASKAEQAYSSV